MKKYLWIAAATLLCTAGAARAQQMDDPPPPPPSGDEGDASGMERPMPPSPAQIATNMMAQFDADKDGKLNAAELAAALAAHRPPRPPRDAPAGTNAPPANAGGPRRGSPTPDVIAAKMIAEFAADKTALTMTELQQALAAHRPMRRDPPGGEHRGPPPDGEPPGPPPDAPADP